MIPRLLYILVAIFSCCAPMMAQESLPRLEAVTIRGGWDVGTSLRPQINRVDGPGATGEVRLNMGKGLYLQLGIGFGRMTIDEQDPVTRWNWEYWTRTYRSYLVTWLGGLTDSVVFRGSTVALKNVTTDQFTGGDRFEGRSTPYAFTIRVRQYVNIIPVTIAQGFAGKVVDGVRVGGHVSLSFISFERNLYLDETWEKKRKPDAGIDSGGVFVFDYGFRNFAEPKRGIVAAAGGTLEVAAALSNRLELVGTGEYLRILGPLRDGGNDTVLPFRDRYTIGLGLRVRY